MRLTTVFLNRRDTQTQQQCDQHPDLPATKKVLETWCLSKSRPGFPHTASPRHTASTEEPQRFADGQGNRATDLSESHPGGEAQGVSEKKKRRKDREFLDENVKSMITAKPLRANKISGAGSR